ncbi:MAG TPA: DMT family transporter [Puia sp.]|jgi:drug/metabolite transporter (DMT)-like permease|nr:DMT family transporter [Puia sp.]
MKKAFLQLHIAVFLAGFTGVLGRLITLNEFVLVWYRLMIACVVLWLIFLLKAKKSSASVKQISKASTIGILLALHWVTFYAGIKISNISTALVCLSSMGFFTAVLEPLMLRKHFDLIEILLGLLVIAGISIVFHFDPQYKMGIIISTISAFLASIFPILNHELIQSMEPETATRWQLSGGFVFLTFLIPVYLYFIPDSRLNPTISDWVWLFILGIICTVISYDLFMKALQKISAFTVNLSYNLEPIYGIALAFIIYREDKTISPGFYYGFCLIVAAVILQSLRLRKISGGKFSKL